MIARALTAVATSAAGVSGLTTAATSGLTCFASFLGQALDQSLVFDLPRCAESATSHLDRMGVSGRIKFESGDFFQTVPTGADAIIMKSIIHDWNDELSLKLLGNCRRALAENGRLLLIERIMPEVPSLSDEDREQAMSDLNMLRGPGGLERTEKKYGRLLDDAGFQKLAVLPAGRFSVIEARVC